MHHCCDENVSGVEMCARKVQITQSQVIVFNIALVQWNTFATSATAIHCVSKPKILTTSFGIVMKFRFLLCNADQMNELSLMLCFNPLRIFNMLNCTVIVVYWSCGVGIVVAQWSLWALNWLPSFEKPQWASFDAQFGGVKNFVVCFAQMASHSDFPTSIESHWQTKYSTGGSKTRSRIEIEEKLRNTQNEWAIESNVRRTPFAQGSKSMPSQHIQGAIIIRNGISYGNNSRKDLISHYEQMFHISGWVGKTKGFKMKILPECVFFLLLAFSVSFLAVAFAAEKNERRN